MGAGPRALGVTSVSHEKAFRVRFHYGPAWSVVRAIEPSNCRAETVTKPGEPGSQREAMVREIDNVVRFQFARGGAVRSHGCLRFGHCRKNLYSEETARGCGSVSDSGDKSY